MLLSTLFSIKKLKKAQKLPSSGGFAPGLPTPPAATPPDPGITRYEFTANRDVIHYI